MSDQHPDRDSLSAYLEEALSIDAHQWIEQHLAGCSPCRAKLEQERAFLGELNSLKTVEPPADFVEGVMARVAQCPDHQRAPELEWRRISRMGWWAASAAATLVVLLGFIGWVLVAGSSPEAEGAVAVSGGIVWFFEVAKKVYFFGLDNLGGVWEVAMIGFTVLFNIFEFIRNAGLMVQLALLLATVALNYVFTRMVLNYQRRH